MKRHIMIVMGVLVSAALLLLASCKQAEVETGTLEVVLSEGVTGSPAAGTHEYNVGDTVAYRFALEAGYETLTVLLDGREAAASGTLTISGDHTLQAYSNDNRQYKLTVTVANGVTGTPAAGSYLYKQGTVVAYAYALEEGYSQLSVKLDGVDVVSSGTITMSEDYVLAVSAYEKYVVRGTWLLSESYNDGSSFEVTVTFSGSFTGGTVSDSEGGSGTWEYEDASVNFTLAFPDVTYEYTGDFSDEDTMSGTCKRYRTADVAVSGTWSATRVSTTAAASFQGSQKKGSRR
ncbi:MAG: hypothetical protein JXO51_11810 [Candidatus Aminicenantes bacterium]|nr:hypothetical protein [Candidatus Aminicenantes bacterium]